MKMKTKKNHLTPYNAYEHAAHLHIYHIIRYEYEVKCFERLILNSTLNATNVIAAVPNLRVFFHFFSARVYLLTKLNLGISEAYTRQWP